jgi:hypothetical protein
MRCAGVEHRGISRWTQAVQVELLQDQVIPNLQEGWERRVAPYDGPEVLETRVQASEDVEDEDPVIDR